MSTYKEIAAKKRAERDTHLIKEWLIPEDKLPKDKDVLCFPVTSGYLSKEEIEITECSAPKICENIKSKEWTSLQVTKAFCHRSQIAHQLTNCLSEIFYEKAFRDAEALDDYYEKTGKTKGPMHGLPVGLKDNINVKGEATTIGFVDFCFNPEGGMPYNSAIADLLLDLGAVFYCKTNVPVAMMIPESKNHVYGATTNPYNRLLSAGGSSGGCAAHAALRGGCIDIGSDIGGSIRIPASFTGLYALRPTFGRFPTYGTRSGLPGFESVNSVNGPLCADVESVEFYLKTMANANPSNYDPKCSFQPWKDVELPKTLNVAFVFDDLHMKPTPPMTRGLNIVKEKLISAGHDVIEWDASEHYEISKLVGKYFVSDGGKHVMDVTNKTGEPLFSYMKEYGESKEIGVSELWDLQSARTSLIKKFLDRWIATKNVTKNGKPIDCIIAAATPFPGNPLDKFGDYVGYTSVFNALDYSVGIFPVTRADKELDVATPYSPRNESEKFIWDTYNSEESDGGSVSLQVACRKSEDEKVIALLKYLKELVQYKR